MFYAPSEAFVDLHCHLLPGIDDGAKDWDDALAMARMAAADGIGTIVRTPHQCGNFRHNQGDTIRALVAEAQQRLNAAGLELQVLPGGDVRIEPDLVSRLRRGEVLTLGDFRRHVLLELPHEMYVPLEPLLAELHAARLVGILSHPERNQGLLRDQSLLAPLVDAGCLMQITAGSLLGAFGVASQRCCEWMIARGLVHFVSTDAHGVKSRRPLMSQAFERVEQLAGRSTAIDLFCRHPAAVARGETATLDRRKLPSRRLRSWLPWRRKAG